MAILSMKFEFQNQSPRFKVMKNYLLKPNSYWQHQNPLLHDNIKTQFLLAATSKSIATWHY